MKSNLLWLALGWAGFYASHSALAHSRVKALVAQWAGANYRFYRLGFNVFSTLFFIALVQWLFSLPAWPLVPETITQKLIGALLFLLGLVVLLLAFRSFNKAEFIGLEQLRPKPATNSTPPVLVTTGLYAYVRHPLYFGIVLMLLGALLFLPHWPMLVFVGVTFVYLPIGVHLEEQKLISEFGDTYRHYQSRVKMLVPFVY
jgi:protein-S-isoprenylcysteine O-methyltransferase Ste14